MKDRYTFRLFGWHVNISRRSLRPRDRHRNAYRNHVRNLRLELTDHHCEICGAPIDKDCHLHRLLPAGTENRNTVENVRVLCGACHRETERHLHYHGLKDMKTNGYHVTDV